MRVLVFIRFSRRWPDWTVYLRLSSFSCKVHSGEISPRCKVCRNQAACGQTCTSARCEPWPTSAIFLAAEAADRGCLRAPDTTPRLKSPGKDGKATKNHSYKEP